MARELGVTERDYILGHSMGDLIAGGLLGFCDRAQAAALAFADPQVQAALANRYTAELALSGSSTEENRRAFDLAKEELHRKERKYFAPAEGAIQILSLSLTANHEDRLGRISRLADLSHATMATDRG